MPSGGSRPSGDVDGIYVSIHAFSSPENAIAALDFSLVEQQTGTDLYEVAVEPIGDYSRALYGPMPYGMEITLLVQKANLLIRVSASSPDGDPTNVGIATTQAIIAKVG